MNLFLNFCNELPLIVSGQARLHVGWRLRRVRVCHSCLNPRLPVPYGRCMRVYLSFRVKARVMANCQNRQRVLSVRVCFYRYLVLLLLHYRPGQPLPASAGQCYCASCPTTRMRIHTHMQIHTCTHTHTYIHTRMHIHTHIYIHTYSNTHMHAFTYIHTHLHTCT